jgi:hypothetical protein
MKMNEAVVAGILCYEKNGVWVQYSAEGLTIALNAERRGREEAVKENVHLLAKLENINRILLSERGKF